MRVNASLGWMLTGLALLSGQAQAKCTISNQNQLLVMVTRCNSVRYTGDATHLSKRGALMQVRVLMAEEVAVPGGSAAPVPAYWQPGTVAQVFVAGSPAKLCALTLGTGAPMLVRLSDQCCDTVPCKRFHPATHTQVMPVHRAGYFEAPGEDELRERAAVLQALKEYGKRKRLHRVFHEGV